MLPKFCGPSAATKYGVRFGGQNPWLREGQPILNSNRSWRWVSHDYVTLCFGGVPTAMQCSTSYLLIVCVLCNGSMHGYVDMVNHIDHPSDYTNALNTFSFIQYLGLCDILVRMTEYTKATTTWCTDVAH
eukprot:3180491-Amphidinium_carterae.1